jgi:hypothetical protein
VKTSFINKSISFLMAFVVLFSTLSFTVESHYCGTNLIDVAIFTNAKVCIGDITAQAPIMKSCCKSEVNVIKGQDKLNLNSFDDLDLNQQLFFTVFVYTYTSLFKSLPKQIIPHKEYTSPSLIFDIQVIDETYLI